MQVLSGDARRAVFAPLDDGALRSEAVVRRMGSAIALGLLGDGEQLHARPASLTAPILQRPELSRSNHRSQRFCLLRCADHVVGARSIS
ncbi:MAG TPA: hypothetical protein VEZ42_10715 [Pseudonocardia sp.]|nr:hypothetical protein [Pseudonocardia sp.]